MKSEKSGKRGRARLALMGALLLPPVLGGGSASAFIVKATGTSSGLELRDAQSTTAGGSTSTNGTCSNPPFVGPPAVTGKAAYQYPLVTPSDFINPVPPALGGQTTPTVGWATIEGKDSTGTSRIYTGPLDVRWAASEVWDGPHGTTEAGGGTLTDPTCSYGYRWPVTSGSITGEVGTPSVADTYQKISCTGLTVGSGAAADGLGVATGSYYARPPAPTGGEVVKLEFPGNNCTIQLGATTHTLNFTPPSGSSANRFILQDRAHGFCNDMNVVENATQTGEPANEVGVTHCVSNYEITQG